MEEEGDASGPGAESPGQGAVGAMVRLQPLQPMEIHRGSSAAWGQLHPGARHSALKEAMTAWSAHAGEGSWKAVKRKGLMLEQVCQQDL